LAALRGRSVVNPVDDVRLDHTDGGGVAEDLVPVGLGTAWRRGPRGSGTGRRLGHVGASGRDIFSW
jgi:hypothetical protein